MPVITVAWTLYFEMFFYLTAFVVLSARLRKHFTSILCTVLCGLVLVGLFFKSSYPFFILITNPVILEFGAGCLIAWLYLHVKVPKSLITLAFAFAVLWISYLIGYGHGNIDDSERILNGSLSSERVFLFGIPAALLLFIIVNLEKNGFNHWPNLALKLGDSSYCLYLVHSFLLWHLMRMQFKLGVTSPDLAIVLAVAAAACIAHAIHCWIEKPMQKTLTRKFFAKTVPTFSLPTQSTLTK